MLVRLLGKEEEALAGTWETPFTDVPEWAAPYVGYAFEHDLANGVGDNRFAPSDRIPAHQYVTMVLRSLGYDSTKDFQWDDPWPLSDQIGLTHGDYSNTSTFTRGDVTIISNSVLYAKIKGTNLTLAQSLNLNTQNVPGKITAENLYGTWLEESIHLSELGPSEYIFTENGYTYAHYSDGTVGRKLDDTWHKYPYRYISYEVGTYSIENNNLSLKYQYTYKTISGWTSGNSEENLELTEYKGDSIKIGGSLYKKVSNSTVTEIVSDEVQEKWNGLDTSLIFAKINVSHVGAANNSGITLVISNSSGHTITLNSIIITNGYMCWIRDSDGYPQDIEIKNGEWYRIYASRGQSDMYLDNNSTAEFYIEYNGKTYTGKCDVNGNTSLEEAPPEASPSTPGELPKWSAQDAIDLSNYLGTAASFMNTASDYTIKSFGIGNVAARRANLRLALSAASSAKTNYKAALDLLNSRVELTYTDGGSLGEDVKTIYDALDQIGNISAEGDIDQASSELSDQVLVILPLQVKVLNAVSQLLNAFM